jgi:hypothetical protein
VPPVVPIVSTPSVAVYVSAPALEPALALATALQSLPSDASESAPAPASTKDIGSDSYLYLDNMFELTTLPRPDAPAAPPQDL